LKNEWLGGVSGMTIPNLIKNIEFAKPVLLEGLAEYQTGQVISRTLSQGKNLSITLFAFDKDEEISSHASSGDAMVYVLDGEAQITIGTEQFQVVKGETIIMPRDIDHALYAKERFKMMLVVVFRQE